MGTNPGRLVPDSRGDAQRPELPAGSWKITSSIPDAGGMYLNWAFPFPWGRFALWSRDTEGIVRKGLIISGF